MPTFVAPGIEKLGRQHYRLWWTETLSGRRRSRIVRVDLGEAKRVLSGIIDAQTRGVYVTSDDITVREYFAVWLKRRQLLGKRKLRDSTVTRYRELLASVADGSAGVPGIGDVRLQALRKSDIEAYYTRALESEITRRGTKVSADTVHKRHKVLRDALDDAVSEEPPLIAVNPAAKALHPAAAVPHAFAFDRDEALAIMGAFHEHRHAMIVMLDLYTGLRISEAMGLRKKDLVLPAEGPGSIRVHGQISEAKGEGPKWVPYAKTSKSRRVVSFGVELADALRSHLKAQAARRLKLGAAWEDNDLVFCGRYGQIVRPSKVSSDVSAVFAAMEKAGFLSTEGATFHTMRHTHATLLLRDRVPVHVVSSRLGHSRIQITLDLYAHVIPLDDEQAASAFDHIMAVPFGSDHVDATLHIICTSEDAERATEVAL